MVKGQAVYITIKIVELGVGAQSFISLKADLHQDIGHRLMMSN